LLTAAAGVAGRGQDGTHGGQFLAFDEHPDFFSIDGFALEQGRCDAMHRLLVGFENGMRGLVSLVDQAANFEIDLAGCFLREVAVLSDLAAEEDLLFFFCRR
jgi:hypothetical protein